VLVRGDEIVGAGCILPLTQNPVSDRSLGTRHRAALGLSEETDALVFVVSEETANVSLASRGTLQRGLTADQVSAVLAGRASLAVAARRG
jgi:diadenylate cyclase